MRDQTEGVTARSAARYSAAERAVILAIPYLRDRISLTSAKKATPASCGDCAPNATSWLLVLSALLISPALAGGEGGNGPSRSPRFDTKFRAIWLCASRPGAMLARVDALHGIPRSTPSASVAFASE